MKAFRIKFPLPQELSRKDINSHTHVQPNFDKESSCSNSKSKLAKPTHSTFYKIDNKASIVNGKLVLFEPEPTDFRHDGRQLMKLLRENNIDFKKYMLGDQEKYLRQIEERQKKKEQAVINQYIDKHIKMEKTTKIEVANHASSLKTTASTFQHTR